MATILFRRVAVQRLVSGVGTGCHKSRMASLAGVALFLTGVAALVLIAFVDQSRSISLSFIEESPPFGFRNGAMWIGW
jgi:hypothetical protein